MILATATLVAATLLSGHASTTPTCHAFNTWNHHRTTANLNTLLTASEYATWSPLGNDTVVVYSDVRAHDTYDLAADVKGLAADCK